MSLLASYLNLLMRLALLAPGVDPEPLPASPASLTTLDKLLAAGPLSLALLVALLMAYGAVKLIEHYKPSLSPHAKAANTYSASAAATGADEWLSVGNNPGGTTIGFQGVLVDLRISAQELGAAQVAEVYAGLIA